MVEAVAHAGCVITRVAIVLAVELASLGVPPPLTPGNSNSSVRAVAGNGTVLLVVDQPSTIGAVAEASAVAVAQAEGVMVGYIPGLAMRRIADLHPGEASTAAREAAIIAGAARSMSHTLRSIVFADEQAAEPSMVCGFDDDLAKQATATSSRLRGLPTQIPLAAKN